MAITSGVDLATVGLRIDGSGAVATLDKFERSADRAGRSGDRLERTARGLRTAFAAMGLGLGVREVVGYADSWNLLQGRVGLVTTSTRMATTVTNELFAAAQRARVGIEGIADLYTKTAHAASRLGASQRDVLNFTETLSKGFIVSSASAAQTQSAILQLGQALQSGVLQGDELRSLRETAPRLMRAIAEGMGVSVGELKRLGAEGKLTAEVVFNAVLSQREKIEAEFLKMPVTIGQSFAVLNNEVRRYIGGADDAHNASAVLGAGIMFIATNLNALIKTVGLAVLAWGSYNVVLKASALMSAAAVAWKGLLAAAMPPVAAAAATEMVAITSASGAILGYERAALGAGTASTVMAGGMTRAAVAAGVLSVAGRGLLAVLTGPVGIALALASVIALLIRHKSATLEAAGATEQFRASLAGMSKTQLLVSEADLDRQIFEQERRIEQMRAAGQEFQSVLRGDPNRLGASGLPVMRRVQEEAPEFRQAREQLAALTANRAVLEEQKEALAELEVPMGRVATAAVEMSNKTERAMAEFRAGLREMIREAEHGVAVSTLQGMAQQEANERFAAANSLLRMRADLTEKEISGALSAGQAAQLYAEAQEHVAIALGLRLEASERAAVAEARRDSVRALRDAEHEMQIAFRYGDARARLRIEYEAVNRATEARATLTGEALEITLATIAAEERHGKQMIAVERLAGEMARGVNDAITGIFEGTVRTFGDLFGWIKQAFTRMLAEMATDRMMQEVGKALNRALRPNPQTMQAPAGSQDALAQWGASLGRREVGETPSGIQMEGITATATTGAARNQAMLKKFAGYLGAALAGASLGQMFGYSTGSSIVGALGGGLSGAAAGFMTAGPVGAIIGGIAGLGAGILGAHRKNQEEQRRLRETLDRNNQRLDMLRESFDGFVLMSGRSLSRAAGLSGGLAAAGMLSGILGQAAGNRFGMASERDLAAALKGGESSAALRRLESQFGVTFQQLGRIARELGIELFDSAGKLIPQALEQFREALELSIRAATQFGNNLEDLQLKQEARNALFNLNSPDQKLRDAYEQLSTLAPDLLKQMGLANLNLDTEAGRNVLLNGLREIFTLVEAGMLTPELLGAFTDKGQLLEAILRAKAGLDAFATSLGTVTTDFPRAMDIVLYEQRFGRGAGNNPSNPMAPPSRPPDLNPGGTTRGPRGPVIFNVYISNEAGDSGDTIVRKMEDGVDHALARGGFLSSLEASNI